MFAYPHNPHTQCREFWEVLIIFKVKRHLFPGSNLNTNTVANVAINRAKMSETPDRKALSLLLQEKRGRCDVSRDDFPVLGGENTPLVPFSLPPSALI